MTLKVTVHQCPSCTAWIVIAPMETQAVRMKRCENPLCHADFSFTNNELQIVELSDELARRGYFTDSELKKANNK